MSKLTYWMPAALAMPFFVAGCAGWDNPTALEDLQADVEFEIEAARIETFEEVEVHVHARHDGAPMELESPRLEIEHEASGEVQVIDMEPEGEGFAAHVMFYEEGAHHVHFEGIPERHRLMWRLGETEVEVHNAHRIIGPYWVELELSPAPLLEGEVGQVHVHVFDLLADGNPGAEVSGLDVELEIHDPNGAQVALPVAEETPGEYEAEFDFDLPGEYELHVEIDVGGILADGEFHIPVLSPETGDSVPGDQGGGGHDHG